MLRCAEAEVSLGDAIRSYLFNAQLVTPPEGEPTLIVPGEARDTPSVWNWIERHLAGNGPIRRVEVVDVRQSMANGGGPACLRLRVVADPASIDPRFTVDEAKLDRSPPDQPGMARTDQAERPATARTDCRNRTRARTALLKRIRTGGTGLNLPS